MEKNKRLKIHTVSNEPSKEAIENFNKLYNTILNDIVSRDINADLPLVSCP